MSQTTYNKWLLNWEYITSWKTCIGQSIFCEGIHILAINASLKWLWSIPSSGMWLHVVCSKFTDISKEHANSILRLSSPNKQQAEVAAYFLLVPCLAYTLIPKVVAEYFSKTSTTMQHHTPQHINFFQKLKNKKCKGYKTQNDLH
jgi:hypothetical protein